MLALFLNAPRPQSNAKNLMRRSSSTDVCCSALFWRAATAAISNAEDGVAAMVDDTLSDFFAAEESGWDVGTGNAMLNVNNANSPTARHTRPAIF